MDIRYLLKRVKLTLSAPFRKTYTAKVCGHATRLEDVCVSFGEKYIMKVKLSPGKENPDYCFDCIGKMAIKCAWCGKPIHIGSPVTLYVPDESFEIPEYAVRYEPKPECLVGCMRFNCADTGLDRAGFWMPPGKVELTPSLWDVLLTPGNQGKAIIVDDLGNPDDQGRLVDL